MKNLRVLVAEDYPGLRELVVQILTSWGHEAHAAEDGEDAARRLRVLEADLVITDFQMPRMNGLELTKYIKVLDAKIRVIVMSGCTEDGPDALNEAARKAGADAFITKPILINELQAVITNLFRD